MTVSKPTPKPISATPTPIPATPGRVDHAWCGCGVWRIKVVATVMITAARTA
jgi:hypothetical protein